MSSDAATVLRALQDAAVEAPQDRDTLGRVVVEQLAHALPQASWTGIYWLEGRELQLGPFVGPATEHTRIPVGRGVCGTAVAEDADQVVEDVRELDNYLACSAGVRSELVVLIRAGDRVLGQIDLDAEEVAAFGESDHRLVRAVADAFGGLAAADV
ncbi:MAG: GAF domain-containing protein [Planctomycetota bacterium]|nr:GAF domain-containing protein [Planctomycetota bacterium]